MPRINDDEYDSMPRTGSYSIESSSESKLRSGANSRESYSEQKLRKGAKPVAKAKVKAKAKPVVGRAGAQTPGARKKLAILAGTPMRPTKPVGDRGMDARLAARAKANRGTPMRPTKPVGDRGMDARLAAKKSPAGPLTTVRTRDGRLVTYRTPAAKSSPAKKEASRYATNRASGQTVDLVTGKVVKTKRN